MHTIQKTYYLHKKSSEKNLDVRSNLIKMIIFWEELHMAIKTCKLHKINAKNCNDKFTRDCRFCSTLRNRIDFAQCNVRMIFITLVLKRIFCVCTLVRSAKKGMNDKSAF